MSDSFAFDLLSRGSNFSRDKANQRLAVFKKGTDHVNIPQAISVHSSKVKLSGESIPEPIHDFEALEDKLGPEASWLVQNISKLGFLTPTTVQKHAFPVLLESRDLLACAPTGSGKTLAFGLPLAYHLLRSKNKSKRVFAVVVVPTKELAIQMLHEFELLLDGKPDEIRCSILGRQGLDSEGIIISTPAMLIKRLDETPKFLKHAHFVVLDEADKLLEIDGFLEQSDRIMAACSSKKLVKVCFSATIPSNVEQLALNAMRDPVRLLVGAMNASSQDIEQELKWVLSEQGKLLAMRQILSDGFEPPVLVFVQSIERAKELYQQLKVENYSVGVVHGEKAANQRQEIIKQFRLGKVWVLICTELLARGIDFKCVRLVVNYDFPQSVQSYIHRIGRTGRAGRQGKAITFYTKEDTPYVRMVANVIEASGGHVPDWITNVKAPTQELKRKLKKVSLKRQHIDKNVIVKKRERLRTKKLEERSKPVVGKKKRNRLNRQKRKQQSDQS